MKLIQRSNGTTDTEPTQEIIGFHKATALYDIERMIEKYYVRVVAVFDLGENVGVVFEEIT